MFARMFVCIYVRPYRLSLCLYTYKISTYATSHQHLRVAEAHEAGEQEHYALHHASEKQVVSPLVLATGTGSCLPSQSHSLPSATRMTLLVASPPLQSPHEPASCGP